MRDLLQREFEARQGLLAGRWFMKGLLLGLVLGGAIGFALTLAWGMP